MGKVSPKRLALLVGAGAALACGIYFISSYYGKPRSTVVAGDIVKTGGSSVVYFVMDKWRSGYNKDKKVFVDYANKGSKDGIMLMIDKAYDVGFSHATMTDEQKSLAKGKGGEVLQIPVAISAIVPIYNVKELKDKPPLNFTGEVLAGIFLGDIKTWNDPRLTAINKDLAKFMPPTKIEVVHRSDSSGTTLIFTDYLNDVSKEWQKKVGPAKDEIKWPAGSGVPRSAGLSGHVAKTDGAIGYVEVLYARRDNIPFGAVRNKDDTAYIHVKPENITAAAESVINDIPEDLTFKLTNRPGPNSYPICAAAWAVCYQNQPAARQKLVSDFLLWVTSEGQKPAYNVWTFDASHTKKTTAVVANGAVTKITIEKGAVGYLTPPHVTIAPKVKGDGTGATATAVLTGNEVTAIEVTAGGTGYTAPPTVTIEPPVRGQLFAPLPAKLVQRVEERLKTIKSVQ